MGERVLTGMVRIGEPVLERDGLEAWIVPMVEAALARKPSLRRSRGLSPNSHRRGAATLSTSSHHRVSAQGDVGGCAEPESGRWRPATLLNRLLSRGRVASAEDEPAGGHAHGDRGELDDGAEPHAGRPSGIKQPDPVLPVMDR
jgi:hypothetical protein